MVSTFNGLPAHVLLVHFVVVLAPLTAILAIVCAVWPAARQRLVWLVLVLAIATTALTPLTVEAGEWLEHRVGSSPALETHAERGDTMLYFALALLAAAILLVFAHLRALGVAARAVIARRGDRRERGHHRCGDPHRRQRLTGRLGRRRDRLAVPQLVVA